MYRVEKPQHVPASTSFVANICGIEIHLLRGLYYGWRSILEKLKESGTDDEISNASSALLLRYAWDEPSIEWEYQGDPDAFCDLDGQELLRIGLVLWAEMNTRKTAKVFPVMSYLKDHKLISRILGGDDPNPLPATQDEPSTSTP